MPSIQFIDPLVKEYVDLFREGVGPESVRRLPTADLEVAKLREGCLYLRIEGNMVSDIYFQSVIAKQEFFMDEPIFINYEEPARSVSFEVLTLDAITNSYKAHPSGINAVNTFIAKRLPLERRRSPCKLSTRILDRLDGGEAKQDYKDFWRKLAESAVKGVPVE